MNGATETPEPLPTRPRRGALAHCLPYAIVTAPVVAEVVRKAASGWTPTSDDGAFAVNAHDVFSSHPTWLGAASTVGSDNSGFHVFHLGPLQWWALALPERFLTQRMGMALGAALVVLVSLLGIVRVARRLGGHSAAIWAAAFVVATAWSVGHITLAEPWNPFIALWPFAYCLVGAVEIATGEARTIPWFALAASFTVQCHYLFLVPVGAVAIVSLSWCVLQRRRWQRPAKITARRNIIATACVITVAWMPTVIQQLRGRPGNLGEWWSATRTLSASHVPFDYAAHYLVRSIGLAPLFARGPLGASQLYGLGRSPAVVAQAIAALVVLALLASAVAGARHHAHRGALPVVALAAMVATAFTISRYPASFPALPHYRIVLLWPVGALVWFASAAAIAPRLTAVKRSSRQWLWERTTTGVAFAIALSMSAAASLGATPPGPSTAVGQRATLRLTDQVLRSLDRHRHYVLGVSGVSASFVHLGVLRELLRAGVAIGVASDEVQLRSRYLVGDVHTTDRLVVASGRLTAPRHAVLIARFDGRGRGDLARERETLLALRTELATRTPRLRPGLSANGDALLAAIAARTLTPELAIEPRLLALIATGDVHADRALIAAVVAHANAVNTLRDREFVVYIEPAR